MKNKRLVDNSVIGLFEAPSYVLFDFETTGLHPPKDKPVQLAYILLNHNLQILRTKNYYFSVQEEIPEAATRVHGLTKDILLQLGAKPCSAYSKDIASDFLADGLLSIAHNASFDIRFLLHFFLQQKPIPYWCTMKYYTRIVRLPGLYEEYKWPKVSETMKFLKIDEKETLRTCNELFQSSTIGYHDARFDIVCMYKMIQKDTDLRKTIQSVHHGLSREKTISQKGNMSVM